VTGCDRHPEPAASGRLRIYLGYAPGAGTTCALLSEVTGVLSTAPTL